MTLHILFILIACRWWSTMRNSKITILPIFLMTSSHPPLWRTSTKSIFMLPTNFQTHPSLANTSLIISKKVLKRLLMDALMNTREKKSLRFLYLWNKAKILDPHKVLNCANKNANMREGWKMRPKIFQKTLAKE